MNKLTPKGEITLNNIYEYIVKYTMENLFPPSIPEIKQGCNIKSTSTIQLSLCRLALDNKIKLQNGNRAITLCGFRLEKVL